MRDGRVAESRLHAAGGADLGLSSRKTSGVRAVHACVGAKHDTKDVCFPHAALTFLFCKPLTFHLTRSA